MHILASASPPPLPGFLNSLAGPLDHFGYWAVLLLVMIEDFGIPVPGETILIAASVYAGAGRLNVIAVGVIGFVAAVVGDNIGFAIGHYGGRALVLRWGHHVRLTRERLEAGEAFFDRHGGWIIVVARFIEGLRQANGIVAGISGIRWWRFLLFNALGAALWVGTWVSLGYLAGSHIGTIYDYISRYSLYALITLAVLLAGYIARHVLRRRRAHARLEAAGGSHRKGKRVHAVLHALSITGSMTWQITWALILGFALSAVVQAVVRKSAVVRLLGDARPRTLAIAAGLGAASSSCSYAAVALARALFRKGADFTAAMAFEIASTNLVIELGVILALLMGWQFTLAEFTGGPVMIVILAAAFRIFLRQRLVRQAREQADQGLAGSMEGHAAMDMSIGRDGSFARRLFSGEGFTSVSHVFVMEWAAIIRDLVIGLLAAGAIAAWVPDSFWQGFFFAGHPLAAKLWGPLIGPVVAIVSFVCSIGNVPLAVVLWQGGISFGGVVAFLFADLIIAPILNIYRKYYGAKMALFLLGTFYAAMAGAGYVVELVFGALGLIPDRAHATIPDQGVSWDYTTWLNIVFLTLAAILIMRFARTGGAAMLTMMGGPPGQEQAGAGHARHAG